jgi:hypothetical protein
MTSYTACLVLHVLGAAGLFAALGVESAGLFSLSRTATKNETRVALGALGLNRFVGPPSILATLAPGLYMTRTWGWPPWIETSLALLAVIVVVGAVITGRVTARLERETGSAGDLQGPIREPTLTASFAARAALLVAILVLMVTKPDLAGCLLVGGAGASVGAILLLRSRRSRPAAEEPFA